jgi:hypothetical protein
MASIVAVLLGYGCLSKLRGDSERELHREERDRPTRIETELVALPLALARSWQLLPLSASG